ncbi:aldolase [Agaricicola taiwanensis]|uniref:Aldolase n=1 Tax=Agaricicola taiwanensis TaxID=591372 RepID=A0A8J2YMH8_9RHOB|nr:aldolase/citrate lyase family protein [Agaricicola taiwanensis]GGE53797.1 aldolase [Agaricicola taiwanensis]
MLENNVKKLFQSGKPAVGTWATLVDHPKFMRLLAATGLDFVILEMEHTDFTIQQVGTAALVARASGITPIVRPAGTMNPHDLTRPLDAGAQGLLLPRVDTPEQLEAIIKATKYYPRGERILNMRGSHTDFLRLADPAEQIAKINAGTITVAMVETQQALDALPEICDVDGLDAIMIGPDDLSQDLGVPGLVKHPKMEAATERVIEVCTEKKIPWGFSVQDVATGKKWIERGIGWMPFANDANVLFNAFSAAASELKAK